MKKIFCLSVICCFLLVSCVATSPESEMTTAYLVLPWPAEDIYRSSEVYVEVRQQGEELQSIPLMAEALIWTWRSIDNQARFGYHVRIKYQYSEPVDFYRIMDGSYDGDFLRFKKNGIAYKIGIPKK